MTTISHQRPATGSRAARVALSTTAVFIATAVALSCSGTPDAPHVPDAPDPPTVGPSPSPTLFHVTGTVTDSAGASLAGADLFFSYVASLTPGTNYWQLGVKSDSNGRFVADMLSFPGVMRGPAGTGDAIAFIDFVGYPGYDSDARYVLASAASADSDFRIRLYRKRQIVAGDSLVVTISPDNSICNNNTQDMHPWPIEWVCRTLWVLPPGDGLLTITATSTDASVAPPGLEAEPTDWSTQYFSIYPTTGTLTFPVSRGVLQRVNVEIPWGSSRAQSFVVKTTLVPN